MRFLELRLKGFGHFSSTRLDLAVPSPGLHVVYGHNEAGKSTTLRAVRGFLFGVPQQSPDTFMFPSKDLRIAARLCDDHGQEIELQRRKGRKNTLLFSDDQPAPDDALSSFLGAVDERLFGAMFGLDHATLRHGARELLEGEGSLSESLFGAGTGTASARRVLQDLRASADELFTTKGRGRKRIVQEIAELRDARLQVAQLSTTASAYLERQAERDQAVTDLESIRRERVQLQAERQRLERLLRLMPLVAKYDALSRSRAELGELPVLPDDVASWRQEALRQQEEATSEVSFLRAELARDDERLAPLAKAGRLEQIPVRVSDELGERLGQHRKAQRDLPKRQGELGAVVAEATSLMRSLGLEGELKDVQSVMLSKGEEYRLRRLTEEKARFDAALAERQSQLLDAQAAAQRRRKELNVCEAVPDTSALEAALARAQSQVALVERVERARTQERQLERQISQSFSSLGRFRGDLHTLLRSAWPSNATLTEFERELSEQSRRREQITAQINETEAERIRLDAQWTSLVSLGAVPTEDELRRLRDERDDALTELVKAPPKSADGRLLRARITAADEYVDRMREQADRVAKQVHLQSALKANDRHRERLAATVQGLDETERETRTRWCDVWAALAVTAGTTLEMRAWLTRVNELVRLDEQRAAVALEIREQEGQLAEVVKELSLILAELGHPGQQLWESLPQLVERARLVQRELGARHAQKRELSARALQAEGDARDAERRLKELKESQKLWRADWIKSLRSIRLPKDASTDEVMAVVDGLSELGRKLDEARGLERRVAGMQRDAEQLSVDVNHLLSDRELGLDALLTLPMDDAVERFIDRHRKAIADARTRGRLLEDREQHEVALRRAQQTCEAARARLLELIRLAGASDLAGLLQVEEKVQRGREYDRLLSELTREIVAEGEGQPLATVLGQVRGLAPEASRARIEEIDATLRPLEERVEELVKRRTTAENQVRSLGDGAGRAAEELAERVARLKASVRMYVRFKLAAEVLSAEVERYREEHQGPVLGAASELFARLTLGRYARLKVGYGKRDEQVILCVHQDDREVEVEHLSDGTRDQLYLALRLATIEHYVSHAESVPLVLDDILIHFDDERAEAALRVLSDVAKRVQVLFFTHHHRLVEIATRSLDSTRLKVHQLQ